MSLICKIKQKKNIFAIQYVKSSGLYFVHKIQSDHITDLEIHINLIYDIFHEYF